MLSVRSTQTPTSNFFSPTEVSLWLANAIDELQGGADPAQVVATLQDIQQGLVPLVQDTGPLWAHRVLSCGRSTDRGTKRKDRPNEDTTWASQGVVPGTEAPFGLFLVADGMGGHANGALASRLARRAFVNYVVPCVLSGKRLPGEELLREGIEYANRTILLANAQAPLGQGGMGTTMTVVLIVGGETAYIANVGDSRTYLYREGTGLEQLTADHSTVARLVALKMITPEEAATHHKRNEIYRCVGIKEFLEVDTYTVDVHLDDQLLLCSDGIYESLGAGRIEELLKDPALVSVKAHRLVEAANAAGGPDNSSVVLVEVGTNADTQETLIWPPYREALG